MEPSSTCTKPRFLSTLSLRRATQSRGSVSMPRYHFYPRSPCGERPSRLHKNICVLGFLSTLSLRRATATSMPPTFILSTFLSTLSLRRATYWPRVIVSPTLYFYPRSPCGERPKELALAAKNAVFLSTLSLRRATWMSRSSAGRGKFLSTLSLRRATGGFGAGSWRLAIFLSTLSLRRATLEIFLYYQDNRISIHALLAESDYMGVYEQEHSYAISIHALLAESDTGAKSHDPGKVHFYPRSPCGERQMPMYGTGDYERFLSTLSLRRATTPHDLPPGGALISIHALLAESDGDTKYSIGTLSTFLSTLSLRRATK